jgi:hypothetical protein
MRVRESFLLVALIWSLLPAFGALPLYLHIQDLSWTDAYFEAVSGLTATGATVLSGLDTAAVDQLLAHLHALDRRPRRRRAGGGHPAAARLRRAQHAQGGNAGPDEGFQDHASALPKRPRGSGWSM